MRPSPHSYALSLTAWSSVQPRGPCLSTFGLGRRSALSHFTFLFDLHTDSATEGSLPVIQNTSWDARATWINARTHCQNVSKAVSIFSLSRCVETVNWGCSSDWEFSNDLVSIENSSAFRWTRCVWHFTLVEKGKRRQIHLGERWACHQCPVEHFLSCALWHDLLSS